MNTHDLVADEIEQQAVTGRDIRPVAAPFATLNPDDVAGLHALNADVLAARTVRLAASGLPDPAAGVGGRA